MTIADARDGAPASPAVQTYQIPPEGVERLYRAALYRTGALMALGLLIGLGIAISQGPQVWPATLAVMAIIVIAWAVSVPRALRPLRARWQGLVIELDPDQLQVRRPGLYDLRFTRAGITRVREVGAGLYVVGAPAGESERAILIPRELGAPGYGAIRATLATWRPIEGPQRAAPLLNGGLLLALLAGFAVIFLAASLWLVLGAGLVLVAFYAYTTLRVWRAPDTTPELRRSLALGLVFIVLLTGARACGLSGTDWLSGLADLFGIRRTGG